MDFITAFYDVHPFVSGLLTGIALSALIDVMIEAVFKIIDFLWGKNETNRSTSNSNTIC